MTVVLALIAAPLAIPLIIVSLFCHYKSEVKASHEAFAVHADLMMEPLHSENIFGCLLDHFEEHTTKAMSLDYENTWVTSG